MSAKARRRLPTGMQEKDRLFYARKVIPKDVRPAFFDRGELMKCLGPDYRAACEKLPAVLADFSGQIKEARNRAGASTPKAFPTSRGLTGRELGRRAVQDILEQDTQIRRLGQPGEGPTRGLAIGDGTRLELDRIANLSAPDDIIEEYAGRFMHGGASKPGTPERQQDAAIVAAAILETMDHVERRDANDYSRDFKSPAFQPEPQAKADGDPLAHRIMCEESRKTLSALVPDVIEAKKPAPGTAYEYGVAARMLEEVLGPMPVYRIMRRDVQTFRKALQTAPSSYTKRFPGKTILAATKANDARKEDARFDKMDPATVAKWLSRVKTLLEWAVVEDIVPSNEAAGVKVEKPKDRKGPPRVPFAPDDLAKIFDPARLGPPRSFGEHEWALLIALHTGARAAEIGQLRLDQVRRERGVLCFAIEEETKNDQSRRVVPVHSALLALGLEARLDRLAKGKKTHLFPDWFRKAEAARKRSPSANQVFANFIPKVFNRQLRDKLGITDKRKVFHSFRHTLKTALARAGVSREVSDAITGHDDDSAGAGYIHDVSIEKMRDALESIHLDGFNLESLRR